MKISVLGGGNGGFATAADLSMQGQDVTLFELPAFEKNIEDVMNLGGINLITMESSGIEGGFAKLSNVTTDIEEALEGAELIIVVVPSFGQKEMAKACAPYLKDGQMVVLHPGNFGGSLSFYNALKEAGCQKDVVVGETECLMYATRKVDASTSWIRGYKHNLGLSVFPAVKTDLVFDKMKKLFPHIIKRNNILETGLSNPNTIMHIPIVLFNLGMVENEMDVLFYGQAFTKAIGSIVDKLDEERMTINNSGLTSLKPMAEVVGPWYEHQGAKGSTLQEISSTNPVYPTSKMPTTLNHRYITEDVPYGLLPMIELIEKYGEGCPTMKSVSNIVTAVYGRDFRENSRSLKSLHLDTMSIDEIKEYLTYGELRRDPIAV